MIECDVIHYRHVIRPYLARELKNENLCQFNYCYYYFNNRLVEQVESSLLMPFKPSSKKFCAAFSLQDLGCLSPAGINITKLRNRHYLANGPGNEYGFGPTPQDAWACLLINGIRTGQFRLSLDSRRILNDDEMEWYKYVPEESEPSHPHCRCSLCGRIIFSPPVRHFADRDRLKVLRFHPDCYRKVETYISQIKL